MWGFRRQVTSLCSKLLQNLCLVIVGSCLSNGGRIVAIPLGPLCNESTAGNFQRTIRERTNNRLIRWVVDATMAFPTSEKPPSSYHILHGEYLSPTAFENIENYDGYAGRLTRNLSIIRSKMSNTLHSALSLYFTSSYSQCTPYFQVEMNILRSTHISYQCWRKDCPSCLVGIAQHCGQLLCSGKSNVALDCAAEWTLRGRYDCLWQYAGVLCALTSSVACVVQHGDSINARVAGMPMELCPASWFDWISMLRFTASMATRSQCHRGAGLHVVWCNRDRTRSLHLFAEEELVSSWSCSSCLDTMKYMLRVHYDFFVCQKERFCVRCDVFGWILVESNIPVDTLTGAFDTEQVEWT